MNKTLTCIVVDDEMPAIRVIQKYCSQLHDLECVANTNKAIEALQLVEKHRPDILFLDIQMPELTGIQLSTLLKGKTNIIFTTAYPQFALEGYELNVVDYLLKPFSFDRFIQAVEKVKTLVRTSENETNSIENDGFFFIKTDGRNRFKKVCLSEIFYLESIKNYVIVHTGNEQIVTYNTLKYYEESLPENQFVKTHRSFLVSLDKIEQTDTDSVWVLGKELPLGDTYRNIFFEKINNRLL